MTLEVSDEERLAIRDFLREVDDRVHSVPVPEHAYVVVTPLGMPHRDELFRALTRLDVAIAARVGLQHWHLLSTAIQVRRRDLAALTRAVRFERIWSTLFPDGLAEAWRIDERAHRLLVERKRALRATMTNMVLPLRGLRACLHPFHAADLGEGPEEARRLEAALALVGHAPASPRCYGFHMAHDPFIARVVGKRKQAPPGQPPPPETREALARMAEYRTRAPKGVFRYDSHEAANRDRQRWTVEAIVQASPHPQK